MEYGLTEHPGRWALVNEVHARPYEELNTPERGSHLALMSGEHAGEVEYEHLVRLCRHYGTPEPGPDTHHFMVDLGPVRVRWERHTEFCTYTFFRQGGFDDPFAHPVIDFLPRDWLAALPGTVLAAVHFALEPREQGAARPPEALAALFNGNTLVGSRIAGGAGRMYSDLWLHDDGFARILIQDEGFNARQAGRHVQRLLEVHTYRLMALLALDPARRAAPELSRADAELNNIAAAMAESQQDQTDARLLERLSAVASDIEAVTAATSYRFGAARAYYNIVQRRLQELREERIQGVQPLGEFLERRMAPAMQTCEEVGGRARGLSDRGARMAALLRARVEVQLETQNQDQLAAMNRRAELQLRLQETVEGLSVVAISYYVTGLIGYLLKGAKAGGLPFVQPDLFTGIAVPLVVAALWLGLKRAKRFLKEEEK